MMGPHRDEVFVAGGQPTHTYVEREAEHIERTFARAIATPNQIVSLSGPTKTGKTVLCRRILGERQYVWIDGGQIKSSDGFWERVSGELSLPAEIEIQTGSETEIAIEGSVPLITTASGSRLQSRSKTERRLVNSMSGAISALIQGKIALVIDDFHYIDDASRKELMRNVKGAVFNGLKVVLLSVTHRVFDAIKDETELTGRFTAISLPHWTLEDLAQIPAKGFNALKIKCSPTVIETLCAEAQENPFLMQKFCWELCFDLQIERPKLMGSYDISDSHDLTGMFERISLDAGLPIYEKLAAGPISRKVRAKRPLHNGDFADIYQATLLAIAESGPKAMLPYDELRTLMNGLLSDMMPQKHEITSALKHLSKISRDIGAESAIDWAEDSREINVVDPYLRFYLRWQIRQKR
ncbi:ATP-binding protein [Emcibacter sp. SYSU 3D8]|uniref:ATP-binding protein n=1 Tax=Emcibacter sp. SYSU 3D8 TaxID=3133969 RepID=UPI0031FF2933